MPELSTDKLERYLTSVLGTRVAVLGLARLGEAQEGDGPKGYGYGAPIRVDYQLAGEMSSRSAVLHTISPGQFGHEHMADRAQELLWANQTFNRLPRHLRSLDVGAFCSSGRLIPLGDAEEFCLLTEYAEGKGYSCDLERLLETNTLTDLDLTRSDALCDYLVEIHKVRGTGPGLYLRRIRELVGHSQCIMGITDSYPEHTVVPADLLRRIEHYSVDWRWKLKSFTHRLRQVHGDFHPWNIVFRSGGDFSVLDRSRGEFGDPADDVISLTMNYLFFSLQRAGRLEGALETLFVRFWQRYLEQSGDREMLQVAPPFVAFRGLVMASPLWYPLLADTVRLKLICFVLAVLESETFDPLQANFYCGV